LDVFQPVVGDRIGKYRLLECVGEGGMGQVFRADDEVLKRTVAIKVILSHRGNLSVLEDRLRKEAMLASRLDHPNILHIYDLGTHDGLQYIVMQFVKGTDLKSAICRCKRLSVRRALDVTAQVGKALAHAHKFNVIHRDIKSTNILLESSGRVVVADFGVAKSLDAGVSASSDKYVGTPAYSAPEQFVSSKIDGRSDIYSLGIVLYEMLTGHLPVQAQTLYSMAKKIRIGDLEPITSFNPDLPEELCDIVNKTLKTEPKERYQSGEDLVRSIEEYLRSYSEDPEQPEARRPSEEHRLMFTDSTITTPLLPDTSPTLSLERYRQALSLFEAGRYEEVLTFCTKALDEKMYYGDVLLLMADCYIAQRCFDKAKYTLEVALANGSQEARDRLSNLYRLRERISGVSMPVATPRQVSRVSAPAIPPAEQTVTAVREKVGVTQASAPATPAGEQTAREGHSVPQVSAPAAPPAERPVQEEPERPAAPTKYMWGVVALVLVMLTAYLLWSAFQPRYGPPPNMSPPLVRDLGEMVYVSPGTVSLFDPTSGRVKEVSLPGFMMDKYEVTNAQYKEFLDNTGLPPPPYWQNGTYPAETENFPVVKVTWNDARKYAQWQGKRLPTEAEWQRAACGSDGRSWPWGEEPPGALTANTRQSGLHRPVWVGQFPPDMSPFGAVDMVGNVAEWVERWVEDPGSAASGKDTAGRHRVARGLSWRTRADGSGLATRTEVAPGTRKAWIGFRCAKSL